MAGIINNIQAMTSGVDNLTKKVEALYAALSKVQGVAGSAVSAAQGTLNGGGNGGHYGVGSASTGQNLGLGGFTYNPRIAMATNYPKISTGVGIAQAGLGFAAGGFAAMPDLSMTMQRGVGFYQAALNAPGMSSSRLQQSTMGAMRGGLSSVGSDAMVAALLTSRGYTAGSKNYLAAAGEVRGAYTQLGIDNGAAANAVANMHTGSMGANLYQYGISTFDAKGNQKSMGTIARELMGRMSNGRQVTAEGINNSFMRGALGANLNAMGFDPTQQTILKQAMIDITQGKNPDLATRTADAKNPNTILSSAGRLATSETNVMMSAEARMTKGFENAADAVEAFNRVLVSSPLFGLSAQGKGLTSGVAGTNAGKGVGLAGAGVLKGAATVGGGMLLRSANPLLMGLGAVLLGGGMLFGGKGGGGSSGFGARFGGPRGGGSPAGGALSGTVTAGYGAKDGATWASTNGEHTGIDFAMPVGTPVTAKFGGVVSAVNLNSDYGTSVLIDHPNGYQTLYAHLSKRDVNIGSSVGAGQVIGTSGESGNANGPHLHLEVRRGKNNPVNPGELYGGISSGVSEGSGNYLTGANLRAGNGKIAGSSNTSYTPGTGDKRKWAEDFLTKVGAPLSDENLASINFWMSHEGGHWNNSASYNPLNTSLKTASSRGMSAKNQLVQAYTNWNEGLQATVDTLTGTSADARGYSKILADLKAGAATAQTTADISNSAWVSGKLGQDSYHVSGGGTSGYGASIPSAGYSGNRTVNINLQLNSVSDHDARLFAKKVKSYLDNDAEISMMGSS